MSVLDEIKEIPASKKDLKKFGMTLGIFFAVLGILFLWRGRDYYLPILTLSAALLFLALLFPVFLRPVQKIWMTLALLIGWLVTRVILCALFYLVVTPLGFIIRLSGRDLLGLKIENHTTYWLDHAPRDKSSYENQF